MGRSPKLKGIEKGIRMQIRGTKNWEKDYRHRSVCVSCSCCRWPSGDKSSVKAKSMKKALTRRLDFEIRDICLDLGDNYIPIHGKIR